MMSLLDLDLSWVSAIAEAGSMAEEEEEKDKDDRLFPLQLKLELERKKNPYWGDCYNTKWLVMASLFPYLGLSIPSNLTSNEGQDLNYDLV